LRSKLILVSVSKDFRSTNVYKPEIIFFKIELVYVSKQEVHGFDQDHFLAAMKKGTEGFPAFAAQVKKIFSRLEASLGAQSSTNCVDCQTKSVLKFHSLEKID
jgi:hypothetical protein